MTVSVAPRRGLPKAAFLAAPVGLIGAVCFAAAPPAVKQGVFARRNLDVELINFGGSTDQLPEAMANGKAYTGIGMALRWLNPLEQGFDVKVTTATHGGCMRLFSCCVPGVRGSLIRNDRPAELRGEILGLLGLDAD